MEKKTDPNAPAMPVSHDPTHRSQAHIPSGLTKREHFAAMALQGILANPENGYISIPPDEFNRIKRGYNAEAAVEYADALIDALNDDGVTKRMAYLERLHLNSCERIASNDDEFVGLEERFGVRAVQWARRNDLAVLDHLDGDRSQSFGWRLTDKGRRVLNGDDLDTINREIQQGKWSENNGN